MSVSLLKSKSGKSFKSSSSSAATASNSMKPSPSVSGSETGEVKKYETLKLNIEESYEFVSFGKNTFFDDNIFLSLIYPGSLV